MPSMERNLYWSRSDKLMRHGTREAEFIQKNVPKFERLNWHTVLKLGDLMFLNEVLAFSCLFTYVHMQSYTSDFLFEKKKQNTVDKL